MQQRNMPGPGLGLYKWMHREWRQHEQHRSSSSRSVGLFVRNLIGDAAQHVQQRLIVRRTAAKLTLYTVYGRRAYSTHCYSSYTPRWHRLGDVISDQPRRKHRLSAPTRIYDLITESERERLPQDTGCYWSCLIHVSICRLACAWFCNGEKYHSTSLPFPSLSFPSPFSERFLASILPRPLIQLGAWRTLQAPEWVQTR